MVGSQIGRYIVGDAAQAGRHDDEAVRPLAPPSERASDRRRRKTLLPSSEEVAFLCFLVLCSSSGMDRIMCGEEAVVLGMGRGIYRGWRGRAGRGDGGSELCLSAVS